MTDRVLRDHSKPCEHGRETSHDVPMPVVGHPEKVQLVPCPGGREVTLTEERTLDRPGDQRHRWNTEWVEV